MKIYKKNAPFEEGDVVKIREEYLSIYLEKNVDLKDKNLIFDYYDDSGLIVCEKGQNDLAYIEKESHLQLVRKHYMNIIQ